LEELDGGQKHQRTLGGRSFGFKAWSFGLEDKEG
jgi:hypothetical protein